MNMTAINCWLFGSQPLPDTGEGDYFKATTFQIDATGESDRAYGSGENEGSIAAGYNSSVGTPTIVSQKYEFDGSTDGVIYNDSYVWTPGSRFTIELFGFVADDATGTDQYVISHYNATSNQRDWAVVYNPDSNILSLIHSPDGTSSFTATVAITGVAHATAYDLAFSWDGSTIRGYKNGVMIASAAFTGLWFNSTSQTFIGKSYTTGAYFDGRFSALRITRKCLIKTTGSYVVPSLPLTTTQNAYANEPNWDNVIFLLSAVSHGSQRFRDESRRDAPLSVFGNTAGSNVYGLQGGTLDVLFDGAGDYIEPNTNPFNQGAGDWTLEMSFQLFSLSTIQVLMGLDNTSGVRGWVLFYDSTTGKMNFTWHDGSLHAIGGTTTIAVNTEYHIRICRSGGTVRMFLNGVYEAGAAIGTMTAYSTTNPQIGCNNAGGTPTNFLKGRLTELRYMNIALNTTTASFTPPSSYWPREMPDPA